MRLRAVVLVGVMLGHSLGAALLAVPGTASAASGGIYISELQTSGPLSGQSSYEFVELYNSSDVDVSLKGWQIEYRAASTANGNDCSLGWPKTPTILPDAVVKAHGFYLLANTKYPLQSDGRFSFDLASTAGTIRIQDANKQVVDALAWGDSTACGAGSPAPITSGQSLERLPGASAPSGGNGFDTGDNLNDFALRPSPEPQGTGAATEAPLNFAGIAEGDPTGQLALSELLINPHLDQPAFVEFKNTGPDVIVLSAYALKVGTASYNLPHHVILSGGYAVVRSDVFPLSLPTSGGSVSLMDAAGTPTDTITWDEAPLEAGLIAGDSDWTWTAKPTPGTANEAVALPETIPLSLTDTGLSSLYPVLNITELLPDPASPATDASDEFIELHNPNSFDVNVAGFSLKSGQTFSGNYTLPDLTVPAGGHIALTSAQTHLGLSNSGSSVGLFDPLGSQIGATVSYTAAKAGNTWAHFESGWAWTTTPTPGAPNILTAPADVAGAAAAAAAAKKVKAAAATKKPKAVAAKAAKAPKAPKEKKTVATKFKAAAAKIKPTLEAAAGGPWVLLVLVGLTICYCIYEFRYDLRNYYHQLRGHTGRSRQAGPALEGRGDDRAGQRPGRGQNDLHPRPSRSLGL